MPYQDKTIQCKNSGGNFVFIVNVQELYVERGYTQESQRCKPCRNARKTPNENKLKSMTCQKCKTKNLADGRDFGLVCKPCGSMYSFDERKSLEIMEALRGNMLFKIYPIQCTECGKEEKLPFEPKTGRPVFCGNCFIKKEMGRARLMPVLWWPNARFVL